MTEDDLFQIRVAVLDQFRSDAFHDAVCKAVREELKPVQNLLLVVAQSLRALLAKLESPIVDRIRENLEAKFEKSGAPLS